MGTSTDLLHYHMDILDRISRADAVVFRKELRKAFKRLSTAEREALKAWYRSRCACRVPGPAHHGRAA